MRILLDETVVRMCMTDRTTLGANYAGEREFVRGNELLDGVENEIDAALELYCTFLGENDLYMPKSASDALRDIYHLPDSIAIADDAESGVAEMKDRLLDGMGWKEDKRGIVSLCALSLKCKVGIVLVGGSSYCPSIKDNIRLNELTPGKFFHFSYPSALLENYVWNMQIITDRHPLYDDFKRRPEMLTSYLKDPDNYEKSWGVWLTEFCLRTGWGRKEFWEARLDDDRYNVALPSLQ